MPDINLNLEQLVLTIKEDRESFAKIYDYLMPRIYSYLLRRVGGKEQAEDLTSKTFLKTVESLHTFHGQAQEFIGWVYRIAHNNLIDYYRQNERRSKLFFYTSEDLDRYKEQGENTTKRNLDQKIIQEQVRKWLSLLEKDEREILTLRFLEELNNEEIAEMLNLKKNAVAVRLHRAMQRLKIIVQRAES